MSEQKWSDIKLKYVAEINPSKSEISTIDDTEVTFLPMENILAPGNVDLSLKKLLKDVYNGYTYFKENDLIVAKVTPCFENGNIAIVQGLSNEIGFGTTELYVVRVDKEKYNNKFFYYALQSDDFKKKAVSNMYGVGGLKRIPLEFMRNYKFKVPQIQVQNKVVEFLDHKIESIQHLICDKERFITLLEEKRQSMITEAITKGLNRNVKTKNSSVEWIGEIPEHWNVQKIKNLAEIHSSNIDKKSVKGEIEILLCNYVDVYYNEAITKSIEFMKATAKCEQIEKFTLKHNDVIITRDSESPNDIAVPAWVAEDLNGILCGYHLALIRAKSNKLNGHYLYYALESRPIREQFYSKANGVTRFGLPKEAIKNGIIPCPPLNEQKEIADYLYQMNQEIKLIILEMKAQIEKLKEYRQSLICEVVTGKIDVRDFQVVSK
ncbi:restriction endonuclease [Bacillus cereus]|uniref:restriction endonuclease subunit S n=1 Tax=Bacillus cereus TaxID=1396 RepID=UPI000BF6A957|nr:restriction endonuclease subunit S [Bacillus cereus]MDA2412454.1 restriction endonuclease subunit S [Bacillus cereus]MDZ4434793.1 restriction endonuclease subunit S [Bacillus cereus]PFQ66224.1 restriction endonuclease [Bacillus cereus]